jgi:hypothetical protein
VRHFEIQRKAQRREEDKRILSETELALINGDAKPLAPVRGGDSVLALLIFV